MTHRLSWSVGVATAALLLMLVVLLNAGCGGGVADCVAVYSDETFRYHDYTEGECESTCSELNAALSCYWAGSIALPTEPTARVRP
jgi:hypothetical protein